MKPDLMIALSSIQEAYKGGFKFLNTQNLKYKAVIDKPNGMLRITVVYVFENEIRALANFCLVQSYNNLPVFQIGYAVDINSRGKELAKRCSLVGISYISESINRKRPFYVEATIESDNHHSINVAKKLYGCDGDIKTINGDDCVHFIKIF